MMRMSRRQFISAVVALAVSFSAVLAFAAEGPPGNADVPRVLEQAKDAARAIVEDAFLRDPALRGIAGAQAEAGRIDAALDTASLIADESLRVGAWRQIALAQARGGDRAMAGKLLSRALLATAATWSVRVDVVIALAEAQAQIGDAPGALKTAMTIEVLPGRAEAWRNIALMQAKGGDFKGADKTAGAIADEKVKAQALRGIAAARAETGDRDGALQEAAGIRDPYLKTDALRRIAVAPAIFKDRSAARDILKQALAGTGDITSVAEKTDALRAIALALLANGDAAGAFRTIALIENAVAGKPQSEIAATTRSEALRAIAISQAQAGDSPRALQTAGSIGIPYMLAGTLAEVAGAQAERGDRLAADATLRKAMQVSSAIREAVAKAPALMGIAQAYAKVGDRASATRTFQQARQTIRASDDDRYKTDALIDLAMAQSGAGDFSGAVETADGIRDVHARAHAWRVVAAAQGENREQVLSWIAKDIAPARKAYALLGLAEGLLVRR